MSTQATLSGVDVFVRHTSTDGQSYTQCHRAWDKERFLTSLKQAAGKANREQKPEQPQLASADQITEDEHLRAKARK